MKHRSQNLTNSTDKKHIVSVYLDDGRVYEYSVPSEEKGREHASAIAKTGYRHNCENGDLEVYPAWRVLKVKVTNITGYYQDSLMGTNK
jgi:hypothetical protein